MNRKQGAATGGGIAGAMMKDEHVASVAIERERPKEEGPRVLRLKWDKIGFFYYETDRVWVRFWANKF